VINGFIPPLLVAGLGVLLVVIGQNDLSTAFILACGLFAVFWIAGVPIRFFVGLLTLGVPLIALTIFTNEFRLHRIITFLFPSYDAQGISYQIQASLKAVHSGGFLGKGIGLGTQKISGIPEVQSDFVFASFAEEGGFIGVALFLGLWGWFLARGMRAAGKSTDRFSRYTAFGLSSLLAVQVFVNLSVVAGFIPATGIPLPFFSAGGSSLLSTLMCAGILLNVSRESRESTGGLHE
jgi:cell division protein FtsW